MTNIATFHYALLSRLLGAILFSDRYFKLRLGNFYHSRKQLIVQLFLRKVAKALLQIIFKKVFGVTIEQELYTFIGQKLKDTEQSQMFVKPFFKIDGKGFICFF